MTRLYIAGPCTGIPEYNAPAFDTAAEALRAAGFDVVNPIKLCRYVQKPSEECSTEVHADYWRACMRECIQALVFCHGVALLDGWEKSRGAMLETHIADTLGMRTAMVQRWLDCARCVT